MTVVLAVMMILLSPMVGPVSLTDTASAVPGDTLYRANAGDGFTADGNTWDPLTDYKVAGEDETSSHGQPSTIDSSVPSGTPTQIWETERWDPSGGEEMQYEFSVPDGQQVEVRLYFYDGYSGTSSVGDRVFDVSIEGQTVLDDFDIIETYGDDTGAMESFTVTSDGTIDVDFGHVTENPQVNAIEIVSVEPQPDTLGGPGLVDFGQVLDEETKTETVTVTNLGDTGDPSIDISGVSVTGTDAGDFSAGSASQTTLAPGESADIPVTFSPSSVDPKSATLEVSHTGTNTPLTVDLSGEGVSAVDPNFGKSKLQGFSAGNPTALEWGPDGRLYVSTQGGTVYALDIERTDENSYQVVNEVQIDAVKGIPNHDDFGNIESESNRQITGLTVGGTASQPVVYVGSSDPEIDVGQDDDDTDTNSGAISRLTIDPGSDGVLQASEVTHDVMVLGLPRSEENHATNGLDLSPDGATLYVAQGGHTNKGAPGDNFGHTPEYALSAAVLEIDLAQIESNHQAKNLNDYDSNYPSLDFYYAIPTIQDHDSTEGDDLPFGGNDGINQAKLIEGGPVQIYSPGYRNPYDLVLAENGQLYVSDHGPNTGWGGQPADASGNIVSDAASVTNHPNEDGSQGTNDQLIAADEGEYGGHAAPIRANPTQADIYDANGNVKFDITADNSPVPSSMVNPVEADYIPPTGQSPEPGAPAGSANTMETTSGQKVLFGPTGGTDEYTASNFGGAMEGDILQVELGGDIERVELSADGQTATNVETIFNTGGPLGIDTVGDDGPFPGTVWTANHGGNDITAFEPVDYDGNVQDDCTGADDASLDEDGDGYDNADEIDAGTDPCSAGSTPVDFDDDDESNLNDPDDDNDGQPDTSDPFAVDPDDGTTTTLPVQHDLSELSLFGEDGQGWTGVMTNGQDDYQDLYDPTKMTVGGASEVLTVEEAPQGDAFTTPNDQQYGFQFGVNPPDEPFVVETTVASFPDNPDDFQSAGLQIGTGDQSNYVKLVAAADGGNGGVQFAKEVGDTFDDQGVTSDSAVAGGTTTLRLIVDPTTDPDTSNSVDEVAVTAEYEVGGTTTEIGTAAMPASWLDTSDGSGLAVGVISTSNQAGSTFSATWTDISVTLVDSPPTIDAISDQTVTQGDSATVPVSASDPDGDSVSLSLGQNTPDFVSLSNGEISIAPQSGDAANSPYTVEVQADDGTDTTTESFQVTVEEPTSQSTSASVAINPNSGVEASTYNGGSFQVTNTGDTNIQTLTLDTSETMLPDMVFDPFNTAGDDVGKEFTLDSGDITVQNVEYTNFHNGVDNDAGYDTMVVTLSGFEPGETMAFSVDMDPTSIDTTDLGSQAAGPVSGLETTGMTVSVDSGSGPVEATVVGDGSAGGATATVAADTEESKPSLSVDGVQLSDVGLSDRHSAVAVPSASQTVTISDAPANAEVMLLRVEGELNLNNVPTGYDIEDFEANKANQVEYYPATTDANGEATVDVTLTDTGSVEESGLNYFTAWVVEPDGDTGPISDYVVLELDPDATNTPPTVDAVTDTGVSQDGSTTVDVSASDDDDSLSLSVAGPDWVSLADNGDGSGTLTLAPGTDVSVGTYTVEVTASDGQATASEEFTVYVDEPDQDGTVVAAINAGGPEFTAGDGTVYEADSANQYYTGGTTFSTGGSGTPTDPDIANTDDDTLYQTERYGDFSYEIPVSESGTYEVTLQFAEIYQGVSSNDAVDSSGPTDGTQENDRLFDVAIEGQTVVTDYDIFSEVGPLAATEKTYTVEVTDGTLNVEFSTVNDNAKISAIKIKQVDATDPGIPPIGDFENAPTDPDGDGLYEDVNGDGEVNVGDAQAIFSNSDDQVVQNHLDAFDFNGDGDVNVGDAQALFASGMEAGDSDSSSDDTEA